MVLLCSYLWQLPLTFRYVKIAMGGWAGKFTNSFFTNKLFSINFDFSLGVLTSFLNKKKCMRIEFVTKAFLKRRLELINLKTPIEVFFEGGAIRKR